MFYNRNAKNFFLDTVTCLLILKLLEGKLSRFPQSNVALCPQHSAGEMLRLRLIKALCLHFSILSRARSFISSDMGRRLLRCIDRPT
jgi:hypothetical protein